MNNILKSKYIKTNISKRWLIQNDFRYSKDLSNDESEIYIYRFVVHKYKNIPVLVCEIYLDLKTGIAGINVYDEKGDIYYPFCNIEYGNYEPLLNKINKKIYKEFKRLGIKKVSKICK